MRDIAGLCLYDAPRPPGSGDCCGARIVPLSRGGHPISGQQCAQTFINGTLLRLAVKLQLINRLAPQRLFELRLVGVGRVMTLRRIPRFDWKIPAALTGRKSSYTNGSTAT